MKILNALLLVLIMTSGAACTSKDKEGNGEEAQVKAGVNETEVLERYDILQINSAATAMRAIIDQSLNKSPDKNQEPVLACEISVEQAQGYMMPLKALIDAQLERESDMYTADPSGYARTRGFETCASKCSCGVLESIVQRVSVSALRTSSAKTNHPKLLSRLERKAALQTPKESLACARQQNWFCSSDLQTYLESERRTNGI